MAKVEIKDEEIRKKDKEKNEEPIKDSEKEPEKEASKDDTKENASEGELSEEEVLTEEELEGSGEGPEEEAEETGDKKASEKEASSEDTKKKGFKWRKEKKDKRDEKIEELTDRVKRQMAEFENFRKRTEKEKSAMYELGAKSVVEKILPVIDNFERGLGSVSEDEEKSPFAEGMRMIYKQLLTELENIGVKPIDCIGKEFDPNLHNAVMQVESDEYESGYVAQEMQKGYMYRDSVVRHSMVGVVS